MVDLIKCFWYKFTLKALHFHSSRRVMIALIKWSNLPKSVSKFTPKKFYEIGPRWSTVRTTATRSTATWSRSTSRDTGKFWGRAQEIGNIGPDGDLKNYHIGFEISILISIIIASVFWKCYCSSLEWWDKNDTIWYKISWNYIIQVFSSQFVIDIKPIILSSKLYKTEYFWIKLAQNWDYIK